MPEHMGLRALAAAAMAAGVALPVLATTSEAALPCAYEATTISGPLGPHGIQTHVVIQGLNDNGVGVGYYYWTATSTTACTWSEADGVAAIPNVPPGVYTAKAVAINNNGWILVNTDTTTFGFRGFVLEPVGDAWQWHMIVPAALPLYGAGWTFCYGINDENEAVGVQSMGSPLDPVHPFGGFRWTLDGGRSDVQMEGWQSCECKGINNDGVVVGNVSQSVVADPGVDGVRGIVLGRRGATILEPPAPYVKSWCTDINNSGAVIGGATAAGGVGCACAYDLVTSSMSCVTPPAGYSSWVAWEINDLGVACGDLKPLGAGPAHPAVAIGATIVDLTTAVVDDQAFPSIYGTAINGAGTVASLCTVNCAYLLTPVSMLADLTCDAMVNADDLAVVLNAWGTPAADLNGDRTTGGVDLGIVLGAWSQ